MAARHYFLWQSFVLIPLVAIGISAAIDFNRGGFYEISLVAATFWLAPGMVAYLTAIAVSAVYVRKRQEVFDTLLPIAAGGLLIGVASLGLGYGGAFPFFLLLQFAAPVAAWTALDRLSEFAEEERRVWPEDKNGGDIRKAVYYVGLLGFYIIPTGWTAALYSLNGSSTPTIVALDLLFAAAQIGYAIWLDRKPLRARIFEVVNVTSTTRHYFIWQSFVFVLAMAITISSVIGFGVPESTENDVRMFLLDGVLAGGWVSYLAVIIVSAMYVRKLREVFVVLLPIAIVGFLIGLFAIWMAGDAMAHIFSNKEQRHPDGIYFTMLFLLQLATPIAAWIALEALTAFEKRNEAKALKKRDAFGNYLGLLGFYMLPTGWYLLTALLNGRSAISTILFVVPGLWFVATEIWYAMWLDRKYFTTRVELPIARQSG